VFKLALVRAASLLAVALVLVVFRGQWSQFRQKLLIYLVTAVRSQGGLLRGGLQCW